MSGRWDRMLKRMRSAAWAASLALLLVAAPTQAAPILDQDSTGTPGSALWDDNDSTLAQVFPVGLDGQLVGIEITLLTVPITGFSFDVAPLNPAFDPVSNPVLTLGSLGSVFLPDTTPTGTTLVDLSSLAITVQAGDMLVFFAEHDDVLSVGGASAYAGGNAWFECPGFSGCVDPVLGPAGSVAGLTTWFAVDEAGTGLRSVAFRSFVVPEPGLALLALVAAALLRGRR